MAITTKRSTEQREIAELLTRWRACCARVAEAGDAMGEALKELRLIWSEADDRFGQDAAGLAYAVPEALVRQFEGYDNRFHGGAEVAIVHADSLYEAWKRQARIRGFLDA